MTYLNTIGANVEGLLNRMKVSEKKVQLALSTIFFNFPTNETVEKLTYSDNIELIYTDTEKEKTTQLFNSLSKRYQETLENKMEGSNFVFDSVNFIDIKF